MKKIIIGSVLFVAALSQSKNVQSQAKMTEPEATDCYKGISFSWRNILYNKETGEHTYYIEFINNYSVNVKFAYRIEVGKIAYPSAKGFNYTHVIEPGKSHSEGMILLKSSEDISIVTIARVCFGDMKNCKENCYATCDVIAGRPNQPCENLVLPKKEEKNNTIPEKSADINGLYENYPGSLPVKVTVVDGGIELEMGRKETGFEKWFYQKTTADTYMLEDKSSRTQTIIKFNGNKEFTMSLKYTDGRTDKYPDTRYKRKSK